MSGSNRRAAWSADSRTLPRMPALDHNVSAASAPPTGADESPAPANKRRSSDPQTDLASIENKLHVAQQENMRLKARNQRLAAELAMASQRGTEAHHLALHDILTGLPNRLLLMQRLQESISEASQANQALALLFIDLDHFKSVNDCLGHAIGDKLLAVVASRLRAAIRADDTACRYGGDEFVVLLPDVGDAGIVDSIAEKVRDRIEGRYGIDGNDLYIRASVGFAIYPSHGDHCDALLRHADASMYACKAARRATAKATARPAKRARTRHLSDNDASRVLSRRHNLARRRARRKPLGSFVIACRTRFGRQPTAIETCASETIDDAIAGAHQCPDQSSAMILHHQHDGSDIQSEAKVRDPARLRSRGWRFEESRVETGHEG